MAQASDDSPPPRRNAVRRLAWGIGWVLALGATAALVVTDDARYLKLAGLAALWAFVLGALAASGGRRDESGESRVVAREQELRKIYELELEREVAARREYELSLEVRIRRELEASAQQDIEALRAELRALREDAPAWARTTPSGQGSTAGTPEVPRTSQPGPINVRPESAPAGPAPVPPVPPVPLVPAIAARASAPSATTGQNPRPNPAPTEADRPAGSPSHRLPARPANPTETAPQPVTRAGPPAPPPPPPASERTAQPVARPAAAAANANWSTLEELRSLRLPNANGHATNGSSARNGSGHPEPNGTAASNGSGSPGSGSPGVGAYSTTESNGGDSAEPDRANGTGRRRRYREDDEGREAGRDVVDRALRSEAAGSSRRHRHRDDREPNDVLARILRQD